MNATDFLHTSDREYNRGICMWASNREWCAKPTIVENYRGSWHEPAGYRWGHLYGIHVPDGRPEYESMWICDSHRLEFLKLNSNANIGVTVWAFDHYGQGTDVTWVPMFEASVRIRTNLAVEKLSELLTDKLNYVVRDDDDIDSWTYLKVVAT